MPVTTGKDNKGCFARWGNSGAKYYYTCEDEKSMGKAKQRATLQGVAIGGGKLKEEILEWLKGKEDQDIDEYWKELVESGEADRYLEEQKRSQEKPGGSNVGQYPGVKKFCGPSGGAPKGSFPINTRKRAIAALSYARNAPNPSGIKKCVCRSWGDLPACKAKTARATRAATEALKELERMDVDDFIEKCFEKKNREGIYEHDGGGRK